MALPLINLLRGWPNPALLPTDILRHAAQAALSDPAISEPGLCYGPDPGYEPLREALAEWLTAFYQPQSLVTPSRIVITGGASSNLACMLSVYTDPSYTQNVFVVTPTYFLACRIFEDAFLGDKLRAVPEDDEGICLDTLSKLLAESEKSCVVKQPRYQTKRPETKTYRNIIYCVPTFANPSGKCMSFRRRQDLVRLARQYDALIICDDVYDFLQWPADPSSTANTDLAPVPRIVDIDRTLDGGAERPGADGLGNACSNASFSKIAAPGIRCGWVEGTDKFVYGVSQSGSMKSGGAPSQLTSTYMKLLITSGTLQNHIEHVLRPAYASRYTIMTRAIETYLAPIGFSIVHIPQGVAGGYFTWLSLPPGMDADRLAERCAKEQSVVIAPGTMFCLPQTVAFQHNLRLCWAWEDEHNLQEGVRRIAIAAGDILNEMQAIPSKAIEETRKDSFQSETPLVVPNHPAGDYKADQDDHFLSQEHFLSQDHCFAAVELEL